MNFSVIIPFYNEEKNIMNKKKILGLFGIGLLVNCFNLIIGIFLKITFLVLKIVLK